MDKAIIDRLKHIETFYEQAPPGMVKEHEEQPEECIPDTEQNRAAREFLANAPSKGLWMPLGKEVKVMQCWRCKNYGHRTGDRECPLFNRGNEALEKFREAFEDPMHVMMTNKKKKEQESKLHFLQNVLDQASTSDNDESTDSETQNKKKKHKKKKKQFWIEKKASEDKTMKTSKSKSKKHSKTQHQSKGQKNKTIKNKKQKRSHSSTSEEEEVKSKRRKSHKHKSS